MTRRPWLLAVAVPLLVAGCGGGAEDSDQTVQAAPLTPVEQCTATVLNALDVAFAPRGDGEGVIFQLSHDYGRTSPEYNAFLWVQRVSDFHDVRSAEGMAAGLEYVTPFVAESCLHPVQS